VQAINPHEKLLMFKVEIRLCHAHHALRLVVNGADPRET
jgi:hypothetical protein